MTPDWFLQMLTVPKWRGKMAKYLDHQNQKRKRDKKAEEKQNFEEPASDADADELAAIRKVDPHRFAIHEEMLK